MPHLPRAMDARRLLMRLARVVEDNRLVAAEPERASLELEVGELRRQVASMQRLLDLKSNALSLATHELRRPVGVARGYLTLIQEGDLGQVPEGMQGPIRHLVEAGHQMGRLLDQLARAARLEDGAEALQPVPRVLGELIYDAVGEVAAEASAKEIEVVVWVQERIEVSVDPDQLLAAVVNLLGNAIRYGPAGSGVVVLAERRGEEIAVAVSDQGSGIPEEERSTVFERHYRSPRGPSAGVSGLGLGLSLVKHIAELHGGRVTLDTAIGQGSTFTILLPERTVKARPRHRGERAT